MNRTIAVFLALVVLLAHTLAIYTGATGNLAPPYDMAHVAYRLARNFVQAGVLAWNPDAPAAESYPSILWIAVAAVAERLYVPVTTFCQTVGILCALATVLVLAKFSPGRLAGVIAPLLFVVSGPVAAAGASGTELTLVVLLITTSFLAYERGWRKLLAASLALTALARAEGAMFCAALLALELALSLRGGFQRRRLLPFLAPVIALGAATWVRYTLTGTLLSPAGMEIFTYDAGRTREGLAYLGDFLLSSGAPLLIAIPLWYAMRVALRGIGLRAFLLALFWCALVAWMGGGPLPFSARMVPILAIWFVAVQEGMILALDSKRRGLPEVAWALFLLGLAVSALASKYPGDLGPLRVENLHRRWMKPHTTGAFGYARNLGRLGLAEEIAATERLRAVGVFLRDQLDPAETVLTAWPGAVGYLSRLRVLDVLGRATPPQGTSTLRSWTSLPRADVLQALAARPGYIVPRLTAGVPAPTMQSVAEAWARRLDLHPDDVARSMQIREELRDYELITIPLASASLVAGGPVRDSFYLLRRRDLQLAPNLFVRHQGSRIDIRVRHRAHEQLVDLRVHLVDADGGLWALRPDGTLARDSQVLARTAILLFPTGTRAIDLVVFDLPDQPSFVQLQAVLRNPGARDEGPFADAGSKLLLPLTP